MESFWLKLPKPFFILAPMADVTDAAFRQIIAKYGKPDVMYTEFVSADGLVHSEGRKRLLLDLKYGENERPIVAQLFSSRPEKIKEAAKLVRSLGFDGLDINMGCPDKTIEKQGAGAALIKNPELAKEIIISAEDGFGGRVSVKTRLGYSSLDEFDSWFSALIEVNPIAITVHLRTRQEMSKVPAHWELASKLHEFVGHQVANKATRWPYHPLVIANGDVQSLAEAKEKAQMYNLDGIMIGKGVFGNPYLFALEPSDGYNSSRRTAPGLEERMRIMIEHVYLFEEYFQGKKSFAVMKKFFKAYIAGHPQAKDLQEKLMACESAQGVEKVCRYIRG